LISPQNNIRDKKSTFAARNLNIFNKNQAIIMINKITLLLCDTYLGLLPESIPSIVSEFLMGFF